MTMTRPERAQRLAQLHEQLNAISQEIARLEREDEQFVAYLERVRGAGGTPLNYADFTRYVTALEQLEQSWAQAGRPRNWGQLPLLVRLRDVLAMPGSGSSAAAEPPAAEPAASPGAAPAASAGARKADPAPTPPSQPGRPPASSPNGGTPARSAGGGGRSARGAAAAESLTEMHSPILNEVVELSKRAEEEFRLAQLSNGLLSCDRALYLLERVHHAPPALTSRVLKLVEDNVRTITLQESDRARAESLRERLARLASAG